ncbi:MAG: glycosyltransferase family 39 protein, partial [Candidatus Promineifilaceae bacterium]|nr:glycosyltransferase family 39 protein [Candidatus Promineifilaceae bacterium]
MNRSPTIQSHRPPHSAWRLLVLLAGSRFLLHLLTNDQYGFHQDALAFLANGLHPDWGYVAYPPLTPWLGRLGLALFGPSLVGIKTLAALAQSVAMIFSGLLARELGGGRLAQAAAALAAGIGLMSLIMGTLFQYISFDYLWWVLVLYCLARLINSADPRWWLAIGLFVGLGLLTKYTMAFLVVGLAVAVLATQWRRQLASPWLWAGALLAFLLILPNLLWQLEHDFVSLEFLTYISQRDRALGRADGFFSQQLYVNLNPFMLPLALAGVYFYLRRAGRRYRVLLLLFAVTLLLFASTGGRFYYAAPLYPILLAGGAVVGEEWLIGRSARQQRVLLSLATVLFVIGAVVAAALMLPLAPVGSPLWTVTSDVHDNFIDQIGWEELAADTADLYQQYEADYRRLAVLAARYGQAGAIELHGPGHDLPPPISPVNSFWLRGYGVPPPDGVLAIGFGREELAQHFQACRVVGRVRNRYGIDKPFPDEIYLCPAAPDRWDTIWP